MDLDCGLERWTVDFEQFGFGSRLGPPSWTTVLDHRLGPPSWRVVRVVDHRLGPPWWRVVRFRPGRAGRGKGSAVELCAAVEGAWPEGGSLSESKS